MMFRGPALFLAGLAILCAGPASAKSADNETIQKVGLLGRWAMDCSSPYGPNNAWLLYAIRGSKPVRIMNYREDLDGTFGLSDIKVIDESRFSLREKKSDGTTFEIVYEKTGSRFHTVSSKRSDGVALIKDGKFVSSGAPTPFFEKCSKD